MANTWENLAKMAIEFGDFNRAKIFYEHFAKSGQGHIPLARLYIKESPAKSIEIISKMPNYQTTPDSLFIMAQCYILLDDLYKAKLTLQEVYQLIEKPSVCLFFKNSTILHFYF